jgi:hypothetical protein
MFSLGEEHKLRVLKYKVLRKISSREKCSSKMKEVAIRWAGNQGEKNSYRIMLINLLEGTCLENQKEKEKGRTI